MYRHIGRVTKGRYAGIRHLDDQGNAGIGLEIQNRWSGYQHLSGCDVDAEGAADIAADDGVTKRVSGIRIRGRQGAHNGARQTVLIDGKDLVVDDRWVIDCHVDVEDLATDEVAQAIVHGESKAVGDRGGAVMDIHHEPRIDVGLGEAVDGCSHRARELELPVGRQGGDGIGDTGRVLGVVIPELGVEYRVGTTLEDQAAAVGDRERRRVVDGVDGDVEYRRAEYAAGAVR